MKKIIILLCLSVALVGCSGKEEANKINKSQDQMIQQLIDNNNTLSDQNKALQEEVKKLTEDFMKAQEDLKAKEEKLQEFNDKLDVLAYDLTDVRNNLSFAVRGYSDWLYYNSKYERAQRESQGYYQYTGFLEYMDQASNTLSVDPVEMLGFGDEIRLRELGYDPNEDMPSGFLVHNPDINIMSFAIDGGTKFYVLDESLRLKQVDFNTAKEVFTNYTYLISVEVKDNRIISVSEIYTP